MFSSRQYNPVRRALTVLTSRGPWRGVMWQLLCGCLLMSVSCSSVWVGTQNGVRFTVHQDQRWSRIENQKGQFTYDSPELTVAAENGRLVINNEDAGELHPGDHVEITDLGTVLVNGQRRGDAFTGKEALQERLRRRQEILSQRQASPADGQVDGQAVKKDGAVKQASATTAPEGASPPSEDPFARESGRTELAD